MNPDDRGVLQVYTYLITLLVTAIVVITVLK